MGVRRHGVALLVATALLALSIASVGGGAAAAHPLAPAAASSHGWTQLSSGKVDTLASIGLARFGTDLEAVWRQRQGTRYVLQTRIVSSSGHPKSKSVRALGAWGTIDADPAILTVGGQRAIAFSGIKNPSSPSPYNLGYEYYLTSANGKAWSLGSGALSSSDNASGSYGSDAVNAGGSPVVVYTDGSAVDVSYHRGVLAQIPSLSHPDPHTSSTGTYAYDSGVGYNPSTKQTWAIWFSNSGKKATEGVAAQRILPSRGKLAHGPSSAVKGAGGYQSEAGDQRLQVAPRVGGGLYAAYPVGYPDATKVALWRLGARQALIVKGGSDIARAGVAQGVGGRIWVYWWNRGTHTIDAAQTNRSASKLGPVCKVTTPNKADEVWDMEGNGSRGSLQLFVNAGNQHQQIYSTVVDCP